MDQFFFYKFVLYTFVFYRFIFYNFIFYTFIFYTLLLMYLKNSDHCIKWTRCSWYLSKKVGQSLQNQNLTFTELSKSSIFAVESLAPPPLPLLVGVKNTTSPSFGSGWHTNLIRVNIVNVVQTRGSNNPGLESSILSTVTRPHYINPSRRQDSI